VNSSRPAAKTRDAQIQAPRSAGGRTGQVSALPHREERLLEHVLDIRRRQRGPQARSQPRRVPHEQLTQRHVIARRQGRDQRIIVHHFIYCSQGRSGSRQGSAKSGRTPDAVRTRAPVDPGRHERSLSRTAPAAPDPACLRAQSVTGKPARIIQICAPPAASSLIIAVADAEVRQASSLAIRSR